MSEPLKKALLEAGRVILLAVVAGLITWLPGYISGGDLPENWVEIAGILLVVLKSLDKLLHEVGKESENASLTKGLTRF